MPRTHGRCLLLTALLFSCAEPLSLSLPDAAHDALSMTLTSERLTATGGLANDSFGSSVALDNDTALIGSPRDGQAGAYAGAAYVFVRSPSGWRQQAKLVPAGANPSDFIGWSVALHGDTAVVGSFGDDERGADAGAVYVFSRTGITWQLETKLVAQDGDADDRFGKAVAISGDTLIVGAPQREDDIDTVRDSGALYLFTRDNGVWTPDGRIVRAPMNVFHGFGAALALDGDTLLAGVVGDDERAANAGAAFVYVRNNGVWEEQAKLMAFDGDVADGLGIAVALDGDSAVLGADGEDDLGDGAGAAYVFTRSGTSWSEHSKLTAASGAAYDGLGATVAVNGDLIVVGAPRRDVPEAWSGAAYVFARENGVWSEAHEINVGNGAGLGASVAAYGNTLLAGAPYDPTLGPDAGAAYVYERLVDSDDDAIPDRDDNCPVVANDQSDSDGDGAGDACDACVTDPDKITPGVCGCGTPDAWHALDTDGDGTNDCDDACRDNPAKVAPGVCGCGAADTDTDSDLTPDCLDQCPSDPNKTEPGICRCGVSDNDTTTDTDNDGTTDCYDECPADSGKTEPGVCGCSEIETPDTDGDGALDCVDPCPLDAFDDIDVDGVCADVDTCPTRTNVDQADTDGDGAGDACDVTPVGNVSEGGCAAVPGGVTPLVLLMLARRLWRRRKRQAEDRP